MQTDGALHWIEKLCPLRVLRVDKSSLSSERNLLAHGEGTLQSLGGLSLPLAVIVVHQMINCRLISNENAILLQHIVQEDLRVVVLRSERCQFPADHDIEVLKLLIRLNCVVRKN
jgi:hypothetical protein